MNEKEIIEGNRLIAEFMGGPITYSKETRGTLYTYSVENPSENFDWSKANLYYHEDWRYLMPVAARIRDEYDMKTLSHTIGRLVSLTNPPAWEEWNSIEEVWKAIVHYLKLITNKL